MHARASRVCFVHASDIAANFHVFNFHACPYSYYQTRMVRALLRAPAVSAIELMG